MNRILLLFLLIPITSFSETWDCKGENIHDFIYERTGDKFIYKFNHEGYELIDRNPLKIVNETEIYIHLSGERINPEGIWIRTVMLNKYKHTAAVSTTGIDKDDDDRAYSFKGNCDLFEGKKISKPQKN